MSYAERADRHFRENDPFPLTTLYIEMTAEFYGAVSRLLHERARTAHEKSLVKTFDGGVRDFVETLKAWNGLGRRSAFARPEIEAFEMRARPGVYAEVDAVIGMLNSDDDDDRRGARARETSDTLKSLIPDRIWGIDITWLKKLLNEILGLLL